MPSADKSNVGEQTLEESQRGANAHPHDPQANHGATKGKATLEYSLRPHRIPWDTLREKHGPVLGMITNMLGVTPRHCSYMMLWPPGYETMSALVPNLMNIPFCDFGLGAIDGELRSLASYVTSMAYGCSYCSAHCAALGTIWKGDSVFLHKNKQAMADEPSPGVFSAKELAVIRICKKAGKVPCKLNVNDIADMAAVLSAREQESVINILALFGFLNRFMDTIGMTLEMEQIKMGKEHLVESGWKAENVYDPEADVELMEDDKVEAEKRERRKRNEGFFSFIRMLFGAKQEDSVLMEQIPSSFSAVEKRCREVAGFVPYYVTKPIHGNARMALSWAFLLRLNEGSEEVPPQLKQIMGYVIATNVDNTILRAHYAFMAFRGGVSIEGLCSATRIINPEDDLSAEEVGAIALAEAASFTPSTMTPTLVGLLSRLFSPAGVIELVNTVSVVFVFHRWSVVYVPNTYEPELLEFLKEHGEALGIDPVRPCTEEEATFDHVAAAVRAGDKSYMRKAAGE